MKKLFLSLLLFFFLLILSPSLNSASAVTSNCWVTTIGTPVGDQPPPPPQCQGIKGIIKPPNLGTCISVPAEYSESSGGVPGKYCKMPPPLHGEYKVGNTWGSEEMINVLYTASQNWQSTYCTRDQITNNTCPAYIVIMDISAHHGDKSEHDWGIAVDLNATTNGHDCVADMRSPRNSICTLGPYNKPATVEFGKILLRTGYFDTVWYNDPDVQRDVFAYAQTLDPQRYSINKSGKTGIRHDDGHENHFHFDVDRTITFIDKTKVTNNHSEHFRNSKLKKCQGVSPKVC